MDDGRTSEPFQFAASRLLGISVSDAIGQEQSRTRQHVSPVAYSVPASLALHDVAEMNPLHDAVEVLIGHARSVKVGNSLRVDDLLTEAAKREVRALWDVKDLERERERQILVRWMQ